ncbi:MAG: PH domain-containing protein [Candidatus Thorarchaeota archaeon]
MSGTRTIGIIQPERLIAKMYQKRAAAYIFYVLGVILFLVGWAFMVMSSIKFVEYTFSAWYMALWSMIVGFLSIFWAEVNRRYTLYIITSWNIRRRDGYFKRVTTRVFLDEIVKVEISADPEDRIVGQGDIQIFVEGEDNPALVLNAIDNPRGIYEIIIRLTQTIPEEIPWSHIEKTRKVQY